MFAFICRVPLHHSQQYQLIGTTVPLWFKTVDIVVKPVCGYIQSCSGDLFIPQVISWAGLEYS